MIAEQRLRVRVAGLWNWVAGLWNQEAELGGGARGSGGGAMELDLR